MKKYLIKLTASALNFVALGLGLAVTGYFKRAVLLFFLFCFVIFISALTGALGNFYVFAALTVLGTGLGLYFFLSPFFIKNINFSRPWRMGVCFVVLCFVIRIAFIFPVRTFYYDTIVSPFDRELIHAGDYMLVSKRHCVGLYKVVQNKATKALAVIDADESYPQSHYALFGCPVFIFYNRDLKRIGKKI